MPRTTNAASLGDDSTTTGIAIRSPRADDATRLTSIAHAANRHWRYPDELLRLWDADLSVTGAFIESHPVYCAVAASEVVGFYALSSTAASCELEHMWVEPTHIGTGVGTALFQHAVERVRALGGSALMIASDPNAEGFYRRVGARRIGVVPSTPPGRMLPLLVFEVVTSGANDGLT